MAIGKLERVYPSAASLCTMTPVIKTAFAAMVVTFAVAALSGAAPAAGSCSAECDRKAAECVDACEAQHKGAKARVECKLGCITAREKCEKGCE
jgi:hypothetical protein